jgi:NADH-quinone oxidoreductase subunit J
MTTTIADFLPPIIIAQVAFWLMVAFTLAGALIAVTLPKILHNILGLSLSMFGVAGIYLFLGSQFVAVMQLLIYVGAICITYIFAIMLSPPLELEQPKKRITKVIAALIVGVVAFIGLVQMIFSVNWGPGTTLTRDWTIKTLGQQLLTRYFLVFELISLLLAIAIVGAIMIANFGQKRD